MLIQSESAQSLSKQKDLPKKIQLVLFLERICQELDLTPTQRETAQARYEAVGRWLAESEEVPLINSTIYAHGSIRLHTVVKPIGRNEFDVDLVHRLSELAPTMSPEEVKRLVGNRLMAHEVYRQMLEEKPRCWRLKYANEFHLDITPSISNPDCPNGGELVPDKKMRRWKATNPVGFAEWFKQHSNAQPRFIAEFAEARKDIEPFPNQQGFHAPLQRIVQLCKRHRDMFFVGNRTSVAPISIIITALLAKSYSRCVTARVYESEFDFISDVIVTMPQLIQVEQHNGRPYYLIPNETTVGENFADKWNQDVALPEAFFKWHAKLTQSLEQLLSLPGIDAITKSLSIAFGEHPVSAALATVTRELTKQRESSKLFVAPGIGLNTSPTPNSIKVPRNTFFGK